MRPSTKMVELSLKILVADLILKYLEDDANRYGPLCQVGTASQA